MPFGGYWSSSRELSEQEKLRLSWRKPWKSTLGWLADELPMLSPYRAHRRRILHVLETLPEIAEDPRPTFTFAHLLSPHHPFVFGENGEDVSPTDRPFRLDDGGVGGRRAEPGEVLEDYVQAYRAQTLYLGKRVAETVAELLARSPEPPVILIQGDHGPNSRWPHVDPAERLPILEAFFVPPEVEAALDPKISPVNSFRVVLSELFGEDLPRLPDRHFLSDYQRPWYFEPVATPLRPPQALPDLAEWLSARPGAAGSDRATRPQVHRGRVDGRGAGRVRRLRAGQQIRGRAKAPGSTDARSFGRRRWMSRRGIGSDLALTYTLPFRQSA